LTFEIGPLTFDLWHLTLKIKKIIIFTLQNFQFCIKKSSFYFWHSTVDIWHFKIWHFGVFNFKIDFLSLPAIGLPASGELLVCALLRQSERFFQLLWKSRISNPWAQKNPRRKKSRYIWEEREFDEVSKMTCSSMGPWK